MEYINKELETVKDGLLEDLKANSYYKDEIETNVNEDLMNGGERYFYTLGVFESTFYYKSAADANHDMNLLIKEWKNEPLNIDYYDRTVDDGQDGWIDGNFKALETVKK
jgi:hypothetical protein